ncbi:TIGR01777 family oxidoreductase [Pelagicoccus mobilis]|uniref:TIGR01777 family oxidoreductase n=1 Tax=Pelagicoccus mobilis TaxID=415221 RepID=A0A934RZZ7_9BACT|nr:TIGR01777 family oxidoreductase [Pelagicoccus mobilis]MBK1879776.1 TIGR01777 family oxidoreductase [Pelagicoccus mobilis]
MKFEKRSRVPASAKELFDWHGRKGAFTRLAPPWQTLEVLREDPGLEVGKRVELNVSTPLGKKRWNAVHVECEDGKGFTDTQEKGPFKSWRHEHRFVPVSEGESELRDVIEFELPFGGLGKSYVLKQLQRSFDYRHWITKRDLELGKLLPESRPMRVAITGGSGFLGTQLRALLGGLGHEVFVVTRRGRDENDIVWNPYRGEIDRGAMEGMDAVIHLAGENLSSGRWTEERKKRLWSSRVDSTRFLVDVMGTLKSPPGVFLSGSGVGIYGNDPEAERTECSNPGDGFLAELCKAWEKEAIRAESLDTRVCLLRTGVVIDPRGGALQKMLPAFRLGLGGPLGSGRQWFPWISVEDWIGAVGWLLSDSRARGAVNLVAPEAMRQGEFARCLGRGVRRPAMLPAPALALKGALGEMADEALLSSCRVKPEILDSLGYSFVDPELSGLLTRVL